MHRFASEGASDFHPVLRQLVARAEIDYTLAVQLSAAPRPTTWPASRVTLMGDAVHVMPPFGAHGGNTALRDAALLAEKLQEAVACGEAVEHAIGAYQEEMVAYAFREVEASQQMMRRFTGQNPLIRWVMLRATPWLRSLTGKSLARAINHPDV